MHNGPLHAKFMSRWEGNGLNYDGSESIATSYNRNGDVRTSSQEQPPLFDSSNLYELVALPFGRIRKDLGFEFRLHPTVGMPRS